MKWSVQLSSKTDLASLAQMLEGSDIHLTKASDGYYLQAEALEAGSDYREVRLLATGLLRALQGVYRLERGIGPAIEVGAICREESDGKRTVFAAFASPALMLSSFCVGTVIGSDGQGVPNAQKPRAVRLSKLIQNCEHANKAFRLWGNVSRGDWGALFKIYEVVKDDVGGSISSHGWATKASITRFTRTANSPEAVGDASRHGAGKEEPPPIPMRYEEAENLIWRILTYWADWKCQPQQQGRTDEN